MICNLVSSIGNVDAMDIHDAVLSSMSNHCAKLPRPRRKTAVIESTPVVQVVHDQHDIVIASTTMHDGFVSMFRRHQHADASSSQLLLFFNITLSWTYRQSNIYRRTP